MKILLCDLLYNKICYGFDILRCFHHNLPTTKCNCRIFDHLEKLIKQIDDENKEMYILGDLNCNLLEEKTLFNIPTQKLNSLYELYQLSHLINEPTRITMKSSSLIDHEVTNTPDNMVFCTLELVTTV